MFIKVSGFNVLKIHLVVYDFRYGFKEYFCFIILYEYSYTFYF